MGRPGSHIPCLFHHEGIMPFLKPPLLGLAWPDKPRCGDPARLHCSFGSAVADRATFDVDTETFVRGRIRYGAQGGSAGPHPRLSPLAAGSAAFAPAQAVLGRAAAPPLSTSAACPAACPAADSNGTAKPPVSEVSDFTSLICSNPRAAGKRFL